MSKKATKQSRKTRQRKERQALHANKLSDITDRGWQALNQWQHRDVVHAAALATAMGAAVGRLKRRV